jgi:nucleotide-binding universal stress UspA family protein
VIERILLAVDDSPDSLAAARLAIELAGTLNARLRIIHVSADHLLDAAVEAASGRPAVGVRRAQSAAAILTRVAGLAEAAGVAAETNLLAGAAGPTILDAVREWQADLVVVGKSARSATGEPYVGTQTRHILEFADQPVLVVPPRPR